MLLILGMLLTLLPVAAFAQESELISPLNATVVTTEAQLRSAVEAAPTDGTLTTIQVGADIQLTDTDITIFPGRNILLTSQGTRRTITAPQNHRHFFLQGSELTLNNIILDGGMTSAEGVPRGGIYVQNHPTLGTDGHLTIQSGTIIQRNGFGTVPESVSRWAVRGGSGTTIIMENGEISSNFGPVGIAGGTFTMDGGVIRNNTNHIGGGAVRLNQGGGPATFIMNGGTIYGNTAPDGGALWGQAQHTFDLRNGTIRDNTAIGNGGAIYVQQMQTVATLPANLYPNLMISNTVQFSGNTAVAPSVPPTNPEILPHIQPAPRMTSVGANSWLLNNYDIAYRLHRTVTFNLNGGTSAAIPAQNIPDGTLATQPTDPSRPNHSFRAWTTDQAGANTWNFSTNVTADTTLFAQWTADTVYHTVTFNLAGGTGAFPNQTVESGQTATAPTTTPTREGWRFTGWSFDFSTPITQSTTVTAQWEQNQHTVSFNLNDGSDNTLPAEQVLHGDRVSVPTAPTREGYHFAYWTTDRAGANRHNFDTPITAALNLYAQWSKSAPDMVVVSFLRNDGTETVHATVRVERGDTVSAPSDPIRDGYAFLGWTLDAEGEYDFDFETEIEADLYLYAQWEHNALTVTFLMNDGTDEMHDVKTVSFGDMVSEPEAPIWDAYTFAHWTLDEAGEDRFDFETEIEADLYLYAQWMHNPITVTFLMNDGTDAVHDTIIIERGSAVSEPDDPTRDGYTFTAWATDARGTHVYDFATIVNADARLYAQWEKDVEPPTIVYNHAFLVGFPDNTIRPSLNITRAEVATIFFRLLDNEFRTQNWSQENVFEDVTSDNWFNNAISTLASVDMLYRYEDDSEFRPNEPATRAEFVAMAAQFVSDEDIPVEDHSIQLFGDAERHWAEEYIRVLQLLGWVQGDGTGNFRPDDQITRAEVAAAINRMFERQHQLCEDDCEDNCAVERMRAAQGTMREWSDNADPDSWYFLYLQEATHSTRAERSECGEFIVWLEIRPHVNWRVLELPTSRPSDLRLAQ